MGIVDIIGRKNETTLKKLKIGRNRQGRVGQTVDKDGVQL